MGRITAQRRQSTSAPLDPRSARGRLARRLGLLGAGAAVGFALASVAPLGASTRDRVDAPSLPPVASTAAPRPATPSVVPAPSPAARAAADAALSERFAAWLARLESDGLGDMARKATGAGLDLVAENVVRRLDEDALTSLIASTTDYSSAEVAEIDDVPGFAMGLARIAMEGTVREAPEPEDGVRVIDFSEEITWDHRAAFPQSQFSLDAPRIYAVFESDALGLSETLAKWTRVDDGEILLFERHRIRSAADSSYVYLDAPPSGFAPGEYRVDFYSADRELRWLASGSHRVSL